MYEYLYALQTARESWGGFLNIFMFIISEFTNYGVPVIVLILYLCVDKKKYEPLVFAYTLSMFCFNIIKLIACEYRPWIQDERLHVASIAAKTATGYSFPSGHSTLSAAFYASMARYEHRGKKRAWLIALFIILIPLTAFSRNWLGAHTPLDVCVGMLLGLTIIVLADLLMKYIAAHPEKDWLVVLIGFIIVGLTLVLYLTKSYPIDYDANGMLICDPIPLQKDGWLATGMIVGWLISWYLDRHFIHFTTDISVKLKWIRGIVSTLVFVLFYEGIMKAFTQVIGIRPGSFLRGFVSLMVVATVMPLVCRLWEKEQA